MFAAVMFRYAALGMWWHVASKSDSWQPVVGKLALIQTHSLRSATYLWFVPKQSVARIGKNRFGLFVNLPNAAQTKPFKPVRFVKAKHLSLISHNMLPKLMAYNKTSNGLRTSVPVEIYTKILLNCDTNQRQLGPHKSGLNDKRGELVSVKRLSK